MLNKGKIFENKFKEDWKRSVPGSFIYRLPDQVSGFKTVSANPCDFITFTQGHLFLIECKSHDGASIPFTAISQYERMLQYKDLKDVHPGIIIWFKEKDLVIWVPITTAEKLYSEGKKSISSKIIDDSSYSAYKLPAEKKRVYMDVDYSGLIAYCKGLDQK